MLPSVMKLTDNVENVICSEETLKRHPELHHYTNEAGFEGIVSSQTLWCSHYRGLVDQDEVRLLRKLLPSAVAPQMDAIVATLDRKKRRLWKKAGGGETTARDLVDSLYGATFDGRGKYSEIEAFVLSLSTHSQDTDFDRKHGIRSQWEEYAGLEGYCIVFDTLTLAEQLRREGAAKYWAWLMLDPVRYADQPINELFPELILKSADTLRQFIGGTRYPEMAIPEFLAGATLLKGVKYKSERELRIVAIPGTATLAKHAARDYPSEFDAKMPLPVVRERTADGKTKQFVALFEAMNLRLPIQRVIVGPGPRQEGRVSKARSWLGDIPIALSRCE